MLWNSWWLAEGWGTRPRKNSEIHIDVSHSRQPLVKGERLVRYEVNTVIAASMNLARTRIPSERPRSLPFQARMQTNDALHNDCLFGRFPVLVYIIIDPQVFGCAAPGSVPGQGNT